jgi:hypothetical protein
MKKDFKITLVLRARDEDLSLHHPVSKLSVARNIYSMTNKYI